jgi:hypothetical protein
MGNLQNSVKEMWLAKIEMAWDDLLLVIIADSSLEEIENFRKRLSALPRYTREEAFALRYQKLLIKEETQEEIVSLLELPEGLIEKGSKLWKITI